MPLPSFAIEGDGMARDGQTHGDGAGTGPVPEADGRHQPPEQAPARAGTGRSASRPARTPTQQAIALLSRREHSRQELQQKLRQRGVATEDAAHAVQRVHDAGWQDDSRFAEFLIRSRISGGYGPLHIRAELATHGLDPSSIEAALHSQQPDWSALALQLLQRRFPAGVEHDDRLHRRALGLLMRRGFCAQDCHHAIRAASSAG